MRACVRVCLCVRTFAQSRLRIHWSHLWYGPYHMQSHDNQIFIFLINIYNYFCLQLFHFSH